MFDSCSTSSSNRAKKRLKTGWCRQLVSGESRAHPGGAARHARARHRSRRRVRACCLRLDGQVVEIQPGTCRGLNPFAFTDDSAGALDARIAALSTFVSLLAAPIIRIRDGRIVSVRPRATTAPLLAVACSIWRSRPGLAPDRCTSWMGSSSTRWRIRPIGPDRGPSGPNHAENDARLDSSKSNFATGPSLELSPERDRGCFLEGRGSRRSSG